MTMGGMNSNNGPGNDLYIMNPSSPKNIPNHGVFNHETYVGSTHTPGHLTKDGVSFPGTAAQMAAAEPRHRSNDSR